MLRGAPKVHDYRITVLVCSIQRILFSSWIEMYLTDIIISLTYSHG